MQRDVATRYATCDLLPVVAWLFPGLFAVFSIAGPCLAVGANEWREISSRPLADMAAVTLATTDLPAGWDLLAGRLELVPDPGFDKPGSPREPLESASTNAAHVLKAAGYVRLWAGNTHWARYVVTAAVTIPEGNWAMLSAACARNGNTVIPGYALKVWAVRSRPFELGTQIFDRHGVIPRPRATSTGRRYPKLAPALRPDFAAWVARIRPPERADRLLAEYEREFEHVRGHQERWFEMRVDITPRQARLWLDGILMASVEQPDRTDGGVSVELAPGARLRSIRVETIPETRDGFLPLDLGILRNGQAIGGDLGDGYAFSGEGLPRTNGMIEVEGIPFRWPSPSAGPNSVDISRVAYRGEAPYRLTCPEDRDPKRVMARVPGRQYRELALIAAANTDSGETNRLNVRMIKSGRGHLVDMCRPVPRWNDVEPRKDAHPIAAVPMLYKGDTSGETGRLWLIRFPLDPGAFQDFIGSTNEYCLDVEFTPAAARRGHPPLIAERVGVHILAATLIESPVEMFVRSHEYGHIFVEPETPAFQMHLRNTTTTEQRGTIALRATDYYGTTQTQCVAWTLGPMETTVCELDVSVEKRGLHYLDVALRGPDGATWVRRHTTFARIPSGTRQAGDASPFGLWVFPEGHYGAGKEAACELISKTGARWAHGFTAEPPPPRYGIRRAYWSGLIRRETPEQIAEKLRTTMADIDCLSVYGEHAINPGHARLFPPELLEDPHPIPLTAEDEEVFRGLWDKGMTYSEMVRTQFPDRRLSLGHGYPQIISTLLSRGFPARLFDSLNLDFAGDRMNFFYYVRQIANYYGYTNVPLETLECFNAGSDRGYYPDRALDQRQADTYIQGLLRGLAMGIVRFAATPEIWDPGGWFHWTGYGRVGLCRPAPELNPKPSYPAYATLTRLLDCATYHSLVLTGSTITHLACFDKADGPVYAAWTVQGRRRLTVHTEQGAQPVVTDSHGNSRALEVKEGVVTIEVSPSPVWLERAGVVAAAEAGPPEYETAPGPGAQGLCMFDLPDAWTVDPSPCPEVEALDPSFPVKQGTFDIRSVEGREPGTRALGMSLRSEPNVSPHRFQYVVIRPTNEVCVPPGTREIGVWIRGNGAAWVDLEVTDANGVKWSTVRPPARYDFGMQYRGPQAFDGWRYVTYSLARPAEVGNWPTHFQGGSGRLGPTFPARLTGVILQQYAKVLCINRLVPPSPEFWALGCLMVEAAAPTPSMTGESATQFAPAPGQLALPE